MADESQWRIKLPPDFTVENKAPIVVNSIEKPLTLKEFSKTTLAEVTKRFAACAVAEQITRANALTDMLFMGYKPLTKWQRRKRQIKEFFGRFHLAWRALRGDDLSLED